MSLNPPIKPKTPLKALGTLQLLHLTVPVFQVGLDGLHGAAGALDKSEGRWVVLLDSWDAPNPTAHQVQTLLHEVIHVAEDMFQISLEETQVDVLAAVIVHALQEMGVLRIRQVSDDHMGALDIYQRVLRGLEDSEGSQES